MSKSVKLYFNPTTAKFEPIGFDGHYSNGNFDDFILSDFLQEGSISCSYLCEEQEWYLKFFKLQNGELNYNFLDKYIYYLKKYSNKDYVKKFLDKNKKEISSINMLIYSENSKSDKGLYKGMGHYIYDDKLLFKRSQLIKRRINSINFENYKISLEKNILTFQDTQSKFPIKLTTLECKKTTKNKMYLSGNMKINWPKNCKKISLQNHNKENEILLLSKNITMSKIKTSKLKDFDYLSKNPDTVKLDKNKFEISKDLYLSKNTYISKDQNFIIKEGVEIKLVNNSILFIEGEIKFNGTKTQKIMVNSDGTGSLIFKDNNVEMRNIIIENFGFPKLDNYILYGGLNFIKSNAILEDIHIKNSKSEDAINFIDSKISLKNISLENIQSDAIDIDFGLIKFKGITCLDIQNDCLDISGSNVKGSLLIIDGSYDKGLSVGENSNVRITDLIVKNSKIGFAVKDGSSVYLENISSKNNKYDLAVFNKKQEYAAPSLKIKNFINKEKKILQSKNSKLIIDNVIFEGKESNGYINSLIY